MKKKLILILFTLLVSVSSGNTIGDAVEAMGAKSFRPLFTQGIGPDMFLMSDGGSNLQPIFAYCNHATWDPTTEQILALGAPHQFPWKWGFPIYKAETNNWRSGNLAPYLFPWGQIQTHTYDQLTLDTKKSELYFFQNGDFLKYSLAGDSWTKVTASNPTVYTENKSYNWGSTGSTQYFPDLDAMVYTSDGRVFLFFLADSRWKVLKTNLPMGNMHTVAQYDPIRHVMYLGGGAHSSNLYKLDTLENITPIATCPCQMQVSTAVLTGDPVTGTLLALCADSLYGYNDDSDKWSALLKNPLQPFDAHKVSATPISNYGVVAFLNTYSWPVLLYKHELSTATEKGVQNVARNNIKFSASPNPFNPVSNISVTLTKNTNIDLSVYNMNGKLVKTLASKKLIAGKHSFVWNGRNQLGKNVSAGVYIFKLIANKKLTILKSVLAK